MEETVFGVHYRPRFSTCQFRIENDNHFRAIFDSRTDLQIKDLKYQCCPDIQLSVDWYYPEYGNPGQHHLLQHYINQSFS